MNVSAIVVHHDMGRELPRTLKTLREQVPIRTFGSLRESPCEAMNVGVRAASGDIVLCCIDGARMLSPGIVRKVKQAFQLFEDPFVYTLGMHLVGNQNDLAGKYSKEEIQKKEDEALRKCRYGEDGYNLFNIAAFCGGSNGNFWEGVSESNCFAVRRDSFLRLGGYNERFTSPGGGLCNLELFDRFHNELTPVQLLGEATFHQFHGGVASNVPRDRHPKEEYMKEYQAIFGRPYTHLWKRPYYLGDIPPQAEWVFCPNES